MMHWVWKSIVATALTGTAVAIAAGIIIASLYDRPPPYYRAPFRRKQKQSVPKYDALLVGAEADAKNRKTLPSTGESTRRESNIRASEKEIDSFEGLRCVLEAKASSAEDTLQRCPPPYLCVAEADGITGRCKHPKSLSILHAPCDPAKAASCGAELRCSRSTLSCEPALRLGESCDPHDEEMCAPAVCRQKRQRTLTNRQKSALENTEEAVNGHAEEPDTGYGGDYVCQKLVTCGQHCDSTSSRCSGRCSVCGKRGVCEAPSSTENQSASVLASKPLLPDKDSNGRPTDHVDVLLMKESFEKNGEEDRQKPEGITEAQKHPRQEEEKKEDIEGGQGRENVGTQHFYRYDSEKEADKRDGRQYSAPDDEVRKQSNEEENSKDDHGANVYLRNTTEDKGTDWEGKTQRSTGSVTSEKVTCTSSGKSATQNHERPASTAAGKGKYGGKLESREPANDQRRGNIEKNRLQNTSAPVTYNHKLEAEMHKLESEADERGRRDNEHEKASTRLIQRPSRLPHDGHSVAVRGKADTKNADSTRVQPLRSTIGLDLQQALSSHIHVSKDSTIHRIRDKTMQTPVTQPHVGAESVVTVSNGGSQLDDPEREHRSDERRVSMPETVTFRPATEPRDVLAQFLHDQSPQAAHQQAQRHSVQQRGVLSPGPHEQRPHDWQKFPKELSSRPQVFDVVHVHQSGQQHKPQQHDAPKVIQQRGHLLSQQLQQMTPQQSEAIEQRQTEHQMPCTSANCKRLQHFEMWQQPRGAEAAQQTKQQKQHWSNARITSRHPQQNQVSQSPRGSVMWMQSEVGPPQQRDTWQRDRQLHRQEHVSDEQLEYQQKRQLTQQRRTENLQPAQPTSTGRSLQFHQQQQRQLGLHRQPPSKTLHSQQQQHWLPEQRVQLGTEMWFPQKAAGMMPTGRRGDQRINETSQRPLFPGRVGPNRREVQQGRQTKVEGEKVEKSPALPQVQRAASPISYRETNGQLSRGAIDALYKATKETAERYDALLRVLPSAAGSLDSDRASPSGNNASATNAVFPVVDSLPSDVYTAATPQASTNVPRLFDIGSSRLAAFVRPPVKTKYGTPGHLYSRLTSS